MKTGKKNSLHKKFLFINKKWSPEYGMCEILEEASKIWKCGRLAKSTNVEGYCIR